MDERPADQPPSNGNNGGAAVFLSIVPLFSFTQSRMIRKRLFRQDYPL